MSFGWKFLLPLAMANIIVTSLWHSLTAAEDTFAPHRAGLSLTRFTIERTRVRTERP